MNAAPCGFVAFRDDGTIADVNETLAHLLGYERNELLSGHMERLLPPGGRIFYHTHIFPLLKMHGRVDEVYLALRTRDGADVPMLLNALRRERDGEILSDCVFVRMIQRHQYEEQLLHARQLAEEASAAKDKFLSMMSHDLRTPLTTIYGNAGALREGMHGPLNAEQRSTVEIIREACRVLTGMVGDILEFAKLESGSLRVRLVTIEAAEVVARAAALVGAQVEAAGLTLTAVTGASPCEVVADPDRLQQILLNLLTNAIKFSPSGGTISIECESVAGTIQIRVIDQGIGIAAKDLERIFSPFVQVDAGTPARVRAQRGVGLGLAISRDLARAMNGDVTVRSTPGAGSVFTLALPAAHRSPPDNMAPDHRSTPSSPEGFALDAMTGAERCHIVTWGAQPAGA